MPFEEFAPSRPPSAQAVGRDEVVMSVRPHLRATKDKRFHDARMVEVSIGAGVALRLGWSKPQQADTCLPVSRVKVLFGNGADLGTMQLARGSSVSYKLRALKGGGSQAYDHCLTGRRAGGGVQAQNRSARSHPPRARQRRLPGGDPAGRLPAVARPQGGVRQP